MAVKKKSKDKEKPKSPKSSDLKAVMKKLAQSSRGSKTLL
jgi:hypothetical protein